VQTLPWHVVPPSHSLVPQRVASEWATASSPASFWELEEELEATVRSGLASTPVSFTPVACDEEAWEVATLVSETSVAASKPESSGGGSPSLQPTESTTAHAPARTRSLIQSQAARSTIMTRRIVTR
jgi:hypothetical protein